MEVSDNPVPLFNTKRATKYLGVRNDQTLRFWRTRPNPYGPKYVKIGGRVFYRQTDLDEFIAASVIDPKQAAIARNRKHRQVKKAA